MAAGLLGDKRLAHRSAPLTKLLLEYKADPKIPDKNGNTAEEIAKQFQKLQFS